MKAGWRTRKLGELLQIQNGYAFDSKNFSPSGEMPLIRIRDLKAGIETETKYSGDYDEKYVVRSGDFLIGMDGEFGCYEWKGNPALLNQRVCRLQDFDTALLPRFLFYGVNSHLKEIEDVTGFTTVKHISSRQILDIDFPAPPFPEQQRIVGILDEAFDGIATAKANAEQNLRNARALFESHLQSVFTQRGEGWVVKRLDDACDLITCGVAAKPQYVDDGVPFLSAKNVKRGEIVWSGYNCVSKKTHDELTKNNKPLRGDILYTRVGSYGEAAVIEEDTEFSVFVSLTLIKPIKDLLNNYYLKYYLNSSEIKELAKRSISSSGVGNLNVGTVREFPIHLPSLTEQAAIVAKLDEISEETQRLESLYQRKLAALDELKKSLLHQAFSGQLIRDN